MHICIIYDCLFPWTIGGAERWYRSLAERLAAEGHRVTYLTMKQWDDTDTPAIPAVEVTSVCGRSALYHDGKRRIGPPLRFGWGVLAHMLRHGRRYDMVQTASFPFFSLLAVGLCRPFMRYRIACDWFEIWDRQYWREYLGILGIVGWWVQALCAKVPQRAHIFSRLHGDRLHDLGLNGEIVRLTGLYQQKALPPPALDGGDPPTLVYAGRFIPEKQIGLLVSAYAIARETVPELKLTLFGSGPESGAIGRQIEQLGLRGCVSLPGFVPADVIENAMSQALCIIQPSRREGYGLVVVEAAAFGVPVIVVAGTDNAATELVEQSANGYVVERADPGLLAEGIIACYNAGAALRTRTRAWYAANADRLSIDSSIKAVSEDITSRS